MRNPLPVALLSVLVVAATAQAADAPSTAPVTSEQGPDASIARTWTPARGVSLVLPPLPAPLRALPLSPTGDKGSSFTDAGFGSALAAPDRYERELLDRARQAVLASRHAGTLDRMVMPEIVPSLTTTELALRKLHDAEARAAINHAAEPNPAAGVGELPAPIQRTGPTGLSPLEQQKLDAVLRGETFVGPPAPAATPRPAAPKLDAGRKDGKGGH